MGNKKGYKPTEAQEAALKKGRERLAQMTEAERKEAARAGARASTIARRRKAAERKGLKYFENTEKSVTLFLGGLGRKVLTGYETENDLNKAKDDVAAILRLLANGTLFDVAAVLAPYRSKGETKKEIER